MLRYSLWVTVSASLLVLPSVSLAKNFKSGISLSTLGPGVELSSRINDSFGIRGSLSYFSYDKSDTVEGINYDADLEMLNAGFLADWYPSKTGFRVTGGVFIGKNQVDLDANNISSITVGDDTYTTTEVNSLNGKVEVNDIAPYVGVGWDSRFSKNSRWNVGLDLGVKFHGSPEVSLSGVGSLVNTPEFQEDLQNEITQFENDIDSLQYYPVVGLNVSYIF
ncbi:MAG: hypothetical protein MK137_07910 [Rickettsiales bacterium]|nr:hypothetical protein [Rickettsiales bacterium]